MKEPTYSCTLWYRPWHGDGERTTQYGTEVQMRRLAAQWRARYSPEYQVIVKADELINERCAGVEHFNRDDI